MAGGYTGQPEDATNNSYGKSKSKEQWVSTVENRIKEGTNWIERRQMLVNVNYFVGNQWIIWDNTQRQVVTAPNPNNMERITHNVLAQRIIAKLAKQTKNRIKFHVMPDTTSQDRIETAKAAEKALNAWWDEQKLTKKTRDLFLNGNTKGWSALKVFFNNAKGEDITPEDSEEPLYTGVIEAIVVDPLQLYIDPAAQTDEDIRWIGQETPKDVDYIYSKYGVHVSPEPNVQYMTNYDVTSTTSNGSIAVGSQKKTANMAMLRELWVKPCDEHPDGLKVTTAGSQLLDFDEKAGPLPYFLFGEIPVPGSVKYRAALQDMLPIQRTINIAKTLMATHLKRMGNSMWAIPMGSEVDEEMLTNDEGGMFYYNGTNGSPMRVAPNDLPSFFDRIIEYAQRDLDDMSGVREIAAGALPQGLDTASGLSLMVEQENEKMAVTSQNYEEGMKAALRRVLQLMKKHYTEERMMKILGPDNEIELVSFLGSDLSGDEDVHIVPGSSLPEMKSAQEDRIMTMYKLGAFNDPATGVPDNGKFLRMMGMGDSRELFEQDQLDENTAKTENKKFSAMLDDPRVLQGFLQYDQMVQQVNAMNQQNMMQAQNQGVDPQAFQSMMQQPPPPPIFVPHFYNFQNHEIHLDNHNKFRKSGEYDDLPPEGKKMVDEHVALHEKAIAERAQNAPTPPQVQAEQQKNELKAKEIESKAQQNAANNQVAMAKIAAEQQKTQTQVIANVQKSRETLAHARLKHLETLAHNRENRDHNTHKDIVLAVVKKPEGGKRDGEGRESGFGETLED